MNPSGCAFPDYFHEYHDELCPPRLRHYLARQEDPGERVPLSSVLRGVPWQVYHDDLLELPLDEVVALEVRDADQAADDGSERRSKGVLYNSETLE